MELFLTDVPEPKTVKVSMGRCLQVICKNNVATK
jgi:hypothetical protein